MIKNIRIFFYSICLILFVSQLQASDRHDYDDHVHIIGAGPAGAYAAKCLSNLGIRSTIFEASDSVGGKCQSFEYQGQRYDHGAIQAPWYYTRVRAAIREHDMATIPSPDPSGPNNESQISDAMQQYGKWNFLSSYVRYIYHAFKNRNSHIINPTQRHNRIMQGSVEDFIQAKNLQPMKPIFNVVVTGYGYGSLKEVPIHHLFSLMPASQMIYSALAKVPLLGRLFPQPVNLIQSGYQDLIQKIVRTSQANVRLNNRVDKIELGYDLAGSMALNVRGDRFRTKKAISTIPLNLMDVVYPDPEDQAKFEWLKSSIVTSPYTTTIFEVDQSLGNPFVIENNIAPLTPAMIGQKFPDRNVYISYAYGLDRDAETVQRELRNYVKDKYNNLDINILSQREFNGYYPHPTIEAVREGFYDKLTSLQGKGGLYFSGSLLGFEIVERAFQTSEAIVNSYFKPR